MWIGLFNEDGLVFSFNWDDVIEIFVISADVQGIGGLIIGEVEDIEECALLDKVRPEHGKKRA